MAKELIKLENIYDADGNFVKDYSPLPRYKKGEKVEIDKEEYPYGYGYEYIQVEGCNKCGADLYVCSGVAIECTNIKYEHYKYTYWDGKECEATRASEDSPCDNQLMAG